MKDGVSFLEENKSFIKGIETHDRPIFGGNGDYGGVNRSSDKEEDAGKKCPGCGVPIKSNWTLCMQCKKKEYKELFEKKVKPLFNELDFVYKKDIKKALNKPDAYLIGFFKEILDTKLLYMHKKGRLNVYHLKQDIPANPGQDDKVESKHECEFCGGPVKYNHIVCSKCRPAWLEERFKKIRPLFNDGELHHAPDITKYASNFIKPSTVYSILYDFTSKGWLEEVKIGRFKYYKLPEKDNAESPNELEKGFKEEPREEPCHIDGLGISMEEGVIEASRVVDETPTPQVLPSQKISQKITSEGQTEHINYPKESQVEKPPKDNMEVVEEEVIEVPSQSLSILITQDHQSNKTIIEIRTGRTG